VLHGLPRPVRDADGEPFWRGLDAGTLLLPACPSCGAFRWPPGPCCPSCGTAGTEWSQSRGRGRVYSWVVVHVPFVDALAGQVPYAVGLIELEEGVRLVSTIEGCDLDAIEAGMPVDARVEVSAAGTGALTFLARGASG
jgi:uncharacterized protein